MQSCGTKFSKWKKNRSRLFLIIGTAKFNVGCCSHSLSLVYLQSLDQIKGITNLDTLWSMF